MTLSSRHRTRNSSPGGLRPSTLLLGHGGSPQLTFTRGWGRNIFVSFKAPRPGTEPRTLAWKAAVLTTTLGPPPCFVKICFFGHIGAMWLSLIWLPVKNMQKWYIIIIINWVFFLNVINFGWREQVETTSTMPVNHISELKLYSKIIWQYNIKPTVHWL